MNVRVYSNVCFYNIVTTQNAICTGRTSTTLFDHNDHIFLFHLCRPDERKSIFYVNWWWDVSLTEAKSTSSGSCIVGRCTCMSARELSSAVPVWADRKRRWLWPRKTTSGENNFTVTTSRRNRLLSGCIFSRWSTERVRHMSSSKFITGYARSPYVRVPLTLRYRQSRLQWPVTSSDRTSSPTKES